jgi:hypothetical protein
MGAMALLLGLIALGCSSPAAKSARDLPYGGAYMLQKAPHDYAEETDESKSLSTEQLRITFENAIPANRRASIRHEPRLDQVAGLIALTYVNGVFGEQDSKHRPPARSLVQWYFWREGSVDAYAGYGIWAGKGAEAFPRLDEELEEYARTSLTSTDPMAYGIARFSSKDDDSVGQAIVFGRRQMKPSPFQKMYHGGDSVEIEFQLLDDYKDPTFYMSTGPTSVLEQPATETEKDKHTFSVRCQAPSKPGRYFIEVTAVEPLRQATDPRHPWRRSLLWVPIYVDVPETPDPDNFIRYPAADPEENLVQAVLDTYDAERRAQHLDALQRSTKLAQLAQDRSIAAGDAALELPPDPDLAHKLIVAGLPAHDHYQSQGKFEFLSEYIRLSLLHPANRGHLLKAEAPWVGVGIAPASESPDHVRERALVEYIVQPVGKIDVDKVKDHTEERANTVLHRAKKNRFLRDGELSRLAQTFAEDVCHGVRKPADSRVVWEQAQKQGLKIRDGSGFSLIGYDFPDRSIDDMVSKIDSSATHLAMGMCQGKLPDWPDGAYLLVLHHGSKK